MSRQKCEENRMYTADTSIMIFLHIFSQKMAATVVHRLHHWPACVAFEQWKEYIAKLRQQKAAYKQIKTRHNVAEMFVIFNNWKSRFLSSRLAEKHRVCSPG